MDPVLSVRLFRGFVFIDRFSDDALKMDDISLIYGLLKVIDIRNMFRLPLCIVLEVENLQSGDRPFTLVKQLNDVLYLEIGQVKGAR